MNGGYDEGYDACSCFWGKEPGSLIPILENLLPTIEGLRVLDVGCGEGKNAAYLASKGATVDAWDVSLHAIDHAENLWTQSPKLQFRLGDARSLSLEDESYDVVIAYGLMHCLRDECDILALIDKLKGATRTFGFHVLCAFNSRRHDLSAHPGFHPTLQNHSWYGTQYATWKVHYNTDCDLYETHPHNQIPHYHSLTRLIAQKSLPC